MRVDLVRCADAQLLLEGPAGLGVLYDRHARTVMRFAVSLIGLGDEADEVVQETFLLAWRKRSSVVAVNGSVLPWLLNAARFEALAARRRRVRRESRVVPLDLAVHDRAAASSDPSGLQEVLSGLSETDRAVVEAVLVDGLSYAEAAERLEVSVATVGKRLQRARARVRAGLRTAAETSKGGC
ncbi:RNA polymerase sigma factor [Amnibacterium endophyticum]|uniref:RNA polymerase sigma factor n=1 Tax=Amnibacterium endophyticum TaxID=2109337 RepID=A0ABW4LHR8_9MICO